MNIEMLGVDALIPYVNNARVHSDEQVTQIASSIKEFGFNVPILIDKDNGVIAGHGRLMAAKKLHHPEVPCIRIEHLTETQKKAYILADNKIALNSTWDDNLLKLELEAVGESLHKLTGFSGAELDEMFNLELAKAELGLLPDEKLDNFLNGDTKILRLAYDDQEFENVINGLQQIKDSIGADDFSTIVLLLVAERCKKL